jgi:hypothetical protein
MLALLVTLTLMGATCGPNIIRTTALKRLFKIRNPRDMASVSVGEELQNMVLSFVCYHRNCVWYVTPAFA